MRSREQGLSLVEATIILAVLSLLTAVIAPSVQGYVQDAQRTAAKTDVEAIGSALTQMLADVGETFVLQDGAKTATVDPANAHGAPLHESANRVDLLVSSGQIPLVDAAFARGGGLTDWDAAAGVTAVQLLDYYLVLNKPSDDAAKAYRTAATMTGGLNFDPDDAAGFNSEQAWRGAYLPGPIGSDPWANRYAVNVEFLARPLGSNQGQVNDVMVLSAGGNRRIETGFAVDGVTSADDIFYLVSGGTR